MERDRFLVDYAVWRATNGLPSEAKTSIVSGIRIDLFTLWTAVQSEGGSRRVSDERLWASVGRKFNPPPTAANFANRVKSIFVENLLEFERSMNSNRAMSKLTDVTKDRSSTANSNSRTVTLDDHVSQESSGSKRPFRTNESLLDLPFPTPVFTPGDQYPNESHDLIDALTCSISLGESFVKSLYDVREIVTIGKRKSQRTDNSVSEENNSIANGDRI